MGFAPFCDHCGKCLVSVPCLVMIRGNKAPMLVCGEECALKLDPDFKSHPTVGADGKLEPATPTIEPASYEHMRIGPDRLGPVDLDAFLASCKGPR